MFAPSNTAFDALPADVKAALGKNTDLLKQVLEFHVIDGRQYSSYATNDLLVQTEAQGLDIRVNTYQSDSVKVSFLLFKALVCLGRTTFFYYFQFAFLVEESLSKDRDSIKGNSLLLREANSCL